MAEDCEKIIIKQETFSGGDRHLYDFSHVTAVPVVVTKVVQKMYKRHGRAYIGILEGILPREVIQIGSHPILYRIIRESINNIVGGGQLYHVKRIDGFNITQTDIDAINVGDKVRIKNRRTFAQRMQYED